MKMNTGEMPEKILDMAQYQIKTLDHLHNSPEIVSKINLAAGKTLVKYFEEYYASLARTNRYLYQHVYEFDMAGDNKYKLFKADISAGFGNVNIKYKFLNSTIPNKNGYVFKNKAEIMESGRQVTIKPKNSNVLRFDVGSETVFTKSEIKIKNPGGNVAGNFEEQFNKYMKSNASEVLMSSGFNKKISLLLKREAAVAGKKITMSTGSGIKYAKQSANKIANLAGELIND